METCIANHLTRTVGAPPEQASTSDLLRAISLAAREHLAERWVRTQRLESLAKARRVYYMSMEFLIGRTLDNHLHNIEIQVTDTQIVERAR